MSDNQESRRGALKIIGAIGATCAFPFGADELYGQSGHHGAHALVQVRPAAARYFSGTDWKLVSRIADLIIPETDTPGAVAAGVPAYVDYVVGANREHQATFRQGLAALRKQSTARYKRDFLALTEEQQIELLTPLSNAVDRGAAKTEAEQFFESMKALTADGYFTSKVGLMEALGYKGNTVLAEFPGCVHEH